jgi:methionine synthase II (cobalamin-independent)
MQISRTTTIEEIVDASVSLVEYLSKNGIRCIRCGEPIWGTLEEAATEKGFSAEQIDLFIAEMNKLIE